MTGTKVTKMGLPELLTHEEAKKRILPFLPKGTEYDRVIAAAQLAAAKNPDILKCTPQSIVMAVAKVMQWGLEIGETAHLVPFGTTLTPIADYKGLCQLLYASGTVRTIQAECVYENELKDGRFVYERGTEPRIRHEPIIVGDRGALVGAYVYIQMPFQKWIALFMRTDEIDAIRRAKSKQWAKGPLEPWYAKKTVVRQAAKMLPKDPKLAQMFAVTEEDEAAEVAALPPLGAVEGSEPEAPKSQPALAGAGEFQDDRDLAEDTGFEPPF